MPAWFTGQRRCWLLTSNSGVGYGGCNRSERNRQTGKVAFGATGAVIAHSVVSTVKRGLLETAEVSVNGAVPQFVRTTGVVLDCPTRVVKPRPKPRLLGRQSAGASAFGSIFAAYPKLAVVSGGGGGVMGWNEPGVVCKVLLAIPATWTLPAVSAATACTTEKLVALPKYVENSNCFPVESNSMMKPVVLVNDDDGGIVDKNSAMDREATEIGRHLCCRRSRCFRCHPSVMALGLTSPAVMKLE